MTRGSWFVVCGSLIIPLRGFCFAPRLFRIQESGPAGPKAVPHLAGDAAPNIVGIIPHFARFFNGKMSGCWILKKSFTAEDPPNGVAGKRRETSKVN